jgi:hypothetical protein
MVNPQRSADHDIVEKSQINKEKNVAEWLYGADGVPVPAPLEAGVAWPPAPVEAGAAGGLHQWEACTAWPLGAMCHCGSWCGAHRHDGP